MSHSIAPRQAFQCLRLVSTRSSTTSVNPYELEAEMVCEYEFEAGEAAIYWPTDRAHPGSPDNVTLLACKVGGIDIYPMLSNDQIERVEDAILEQLQ